MGLTGRLLRRRRAKRIAPEQAEMPLAALVGSPNVGKSSVFNALTGMHQHTGNWSGKTVELAFGRCAELGLMLADLPGCYSLSESGGEEGVTRDFLVSRAASGELAAVIVVADACCLERTLALALEVSGQAGLAARTILCINLADEARKRGISIKRELLEERLGMPVVLLSAKTGEGFGDLLSAVKRILRSGKESGAAQSGDEGAAQGPPPGRAEAAEARLKRCSELLSGAVETEHGGGTEAKKGLTERIDRFAAGKYTAFAGMLLLLALVFYITIVGANYPSELLARLFCRAEELLNALFDRIGAAPWLTGALLSGMFRTIGWVVSVMLPPMAIFFPLFTLLEDLGYLPRAAFCLDRCFSAAGGCGKQALTIAMGFGCNAAAVVGCRIIPNRRERLIAILTNSLVPCNGRFPLIITLCSVFLAGTAAGSAALVCCFSALSAAMSLAVTFLLGKTLLRGKRSAFIMELPPYRVPNVPQVLVRSMIDRTLHVLGRAAAAAAPAGLLIWLLANISAGGATLLEHLCGFLDPAAEFFGLNGIILASFILALPANELVLPIALMCMTQGGSLNALAAGRGVGEILAAHGWTALTAVSVILFSMFHWPCATTLLTIRREAGAKWVPLALLLPAAVGLALLAAVNCAARLFA